jgi:predicted hydrocarbon binding protein
MAAAPSHGELSYERALAKSVLDHDLPLEGEDAVTLSAAMSSLTTSLKRLSYNYGMTVGRSVYRLFDERRHYHWYGDSIQDLVLFFEKLGYSYILYKILTDNVEIVIHRKGRTDLGCNIHSFDAGVMAGFLGAARGDFIRVSERECCNNGAEACRFTTAGSLGDPFTTDMDGIFSVLKASASEGRVRPEYQMLGTAPLMKADYSDQINALFFSLGQTAASAIPEGKISAKALQHAASEMERFGLGRLEYAPRPLKMEIRLDGVKAKKEFVDISISFLNGMIGRHFGKPLRSQLTQGRNGSYRIIVTQ